VQDWVILKNLSDLTSQQLVIGYINDRATPRPMSLEKSDWINILQNSSHVGIISLWGFPLLQKR
jgi:hypothetical protein